MIVLLLAASVATAASERVALFGERSGVALLHQCSRGTPAAQRVWKPSLTQVDAAEARVVATLATRPGEPVIRTLAELRRGWRVEAIGIGDRGRRGLYLSYVPRRNGFGVKGPTVICDGGPALFGAVVDLATGRVVLDFNGVA